MFFVSRPFDFLESVRKKKENKKDEKRKNKTEEKPFFVGLFCEGVSLRETSSTKRKGNKEAKKRKNKTEKKKCSFFLRR